MQWEPLGTTSQYKQLILITHAKIACYLITWASFHPEKHKTTLCFHPSGSHCLLLFFPHWLHTGPVHFPGKKEWVWARKKEEPMLVFV